MKFAICINEGGVGEHILFVRLDDEGAVKVLDPSRATLFSSEEEAEDRLYNNSLFPEKYSVIFEDELAKRAERFREFIDSDTVIGRVEEQLEPMLNFKFDPERHTIYDVIDWWHDYYTVGRGSEVSLSVCSSWHWAFSHFAGAAAFHGFKIHLTSGEERGMIYPEFLVDLDFPFEQFQREVNYFIEKYPETIEFGFNLFVKGYSGCRIAPISLKKRLWRVEHLSIDGGLEVCYNGFVNYVKDRVGRRPY